jgi:DNA transposition AAA+ family ATPase
MNNPDEMIIDIEEQRTWIRAYRDKLDKSWRELAAATGIASSTLQLFTANNYTGRNDRVAKDVYRFRQTLQSQSDAGEGILPEPGFFDTLTSARITTNLTIAHMGRITASATGPGTGKTKTARRYQSTVSNCWIVTMRPTTKSVPAMILEVLKALGSVARPGWTKHGSQQVIDSVRHKRGLIVVDEANHLCVDAFEEMRTWHDETGVGICLLGNEELEMRIRSPERKHAFARLNSRIAQWHIQDRPEADDVEAFCDAYQIADPAMRKILCDIGLSGTGGLRECRQIVDSAAMLAMGDARPISYADLIDARDARVVRNIR